MKLRTLISKTAAHASAPDNNLRILTGKEADPEIRGIEYDSRRIKEGDLFVAIRGYQTDGHHFIPDAVKKGASAVVCEEMVEDSPVPVIQVPESRKTLALLSQAFYETHSLPFCLAGITGTNGKTTLALLIRHLESLSGRKAAALGTLGFIAPFLISRISERTTPESRDLHEIFHLCRENSIDTLSMEVSSIALALYRVENVSFNVAVFTNLSQDHLDFHQSMDDYFKSKKRLFRQLKSDGTAIINTDDAYGLQLYEALKCRRKSCSLDNSETDYHYSSLHLSENGIQGSLQTPRGLCEVKAPLPGRFNAMNLLQAVAVLEELHPGDTLKDLDLKDIPPLPGRMEMIQTGSHGTVIIDYAHTPDAIENILKAIGEIPHERTIVLFGCGGDRDKSKRPDMGRIVEDYADNIIITNDNPRSENPDRIIEDILKGFKGYIRPEIVTDRRQAIHRALAAGTPGDLILLLGKGAETIIEIQGRKIPFNDKKTVLSWMQDNEN